MAKKGKDPAFLFYFQDFLVGTAHMTDAQIGKYIKCLCYQASRGSIRPNHMKEICKTPGSRKVVMEKFTLGDDGELRNDRLSDEMVKRANYADSRRNNRLGSKKGNTSKSHDVIMNTHMENEIENEVKVKKNKTIRMKRPTLEEVKSLFKEKGHPEMADKFFNFYESKGWLVGKVPMKKWESAAAGWINRNDEKKPTTRSDNAIVPKPGKYGGLCDV